MTQPPTVPGQPPFQPGAPYAPPAVPAPAARRGWVMPLIVTAIFLVVGGIVMVGLVAYLDNSRERISGNGFEVAVQSCSVDGGGMFPMAKMTYTVKNTAATARKATIQIEYRDDDGNLLDTDTAVTGPIPAGDSIRAEESTQLNSAAPGGRCKLVGVS